MTTDLAAKVLKAAQIRAVLLGAETIPDAVGVFYTRAGWGCSVPDAEPTLFPDEDAALRWAFAEYVRQIDALKTDKQKEIDEIRAILDQVKDLKRGEAA